MLKIFCLLPVLFEDTFTSFFKEKKSKRRGRYGTYLVQSLRQARGFFILRKLAPRLANMAAELGFNLIASVSSSTAFSHSPFKNIHQIIQVRRYGTYV
jgi:hypothetical protein